LDWTDGRRDEGEEDLDCWASNFRTQGKSICPAGVLILLFLVPSLVRVSSAEMEGTGSLGVYGPSSRSISPTFSNVSLG